MAVYSKLDKNDINKIIRQYEFEVFDYQEMEGGASNSNYLLNTSTGKCMMTIIEDGGFEAANQLAQLLDWFDKNDFFTTRMLASKSGKKVLKWQEKPVFLKNFLPAMVNYQPTLDQIEKIGGALAGFHQIAAPDFLPKIHVYEQPRFADVIGSGKDPQYETWLRHKLNTMHGHPSINAPKGIVHGDLFPDNVLFQENASPIIIDFEEACYHFLVFDLGMTIIGLCSSGSDLHFDKANSLLKGYEKVRKLEPIEKKHLQFFTAYGTMKTSNWRFWKYHIQAPNPARHHLHQVMADLADKIIEMDQNWFLKQVLPTS